MVPGSMDYLFWPATFQDAVIPPEQTGPVPHLLTRHSEALLGKCGGNETDGKNVEWQTYSRQAINKIPVVPMAGNERYGIASSGKAMTQF